VVVSVLVVVAAGRRVGVVSVVVAVRVLRAGRLLCSTVALTFELLVIVVAVELLTGPLVVVAVLVHEKLVFRFFDA